MRETVGQIAIILFVAGAVFFTNLGNSRLWDRDEPRNAGCAAEMLARGDWVVPTFNDELRHQKPILSYWLIMAAYSVFGVNEFSARFWSASLALGTTLATYLLARRLTDSRIALLAALALATSLMFDIAARAVTPDSVLIFFSTLGIMFYVLGTFSNNAGQLKLTAAGKWFPQRAKYYLPLFGSLGFAVLAKGPVGFVLPMAIIGLFLLIQTRVPRDSLTAPSRLNAIGGWLLDGLRTFHPQHFLKTLASMRPLIAAIVVLSIAAPWFVIVDRSTEGDFTRLFFVGEHFGRATQALENHHGGWWFYPLAILVGFFPWSVFWGPISVDLITRKRSQSPGQKAEASSNSPNQQWAISLAVCWIVVQVGAFSLVQTKLPSYVTPCYPALALLTAICLMDLANDRISISRYWFHAAFVGMIVAGLLVTGGVGWAASQFLPGQVWLAAIGLIPIGAGSLLILLLAKQHTSAIPWVTTAASAMFCWVLFGFGTMSLDQEQHSHSITDHINQLPGSHVASYGALESSWVFYCQRPISELSLGQSESPRDLQRHWHPKPRLTPESYLGMHPEGWIITTDEYLEDIKKRLPESYQVIQTADYFLKNKRLYLLGPRDRAIQHAQAPTSTTHY